MFLIAGVSPKTRQIDANPRRCESCGLHQAYLTRIDHYFSLFFIPLFPVKKGNSFLLCDRCQNQSIRGHASQAASENTAQICSTCGNQLETRFLYCPACGKRR